jgi:hypothetical protein
MGPLDESCLGMSLSNWEIDILQNALLPLDISRERMDVTVRADSDYLNRGPATRWDVDVLPGDQDDLLRFEIEPGGPESLLRTDHFGSSIMNFNHADILVNPVVLPSEQIAPDHATTAPLISSNLVSTVHGSKRKSSSRPPPSRSAKRSRNAGACARCWLKKREVSIENLIIG